MKKFICFPCLLGALAAFGRPVVVGLADSCRTNTLVLVATSQANAVYAVGAVPYVLPSTTNGNVLSAQVGLLDAVLIGCEQDGNAQRAVLEKALVFEATQRGIPVLHGRIGMLQVVEARSARSMKVVAIPDYCATNGCVAAKPNMTAALELAGFVPIIIPYTTDDAKLADALADADALMVAGGIGDLQDYPRRCAFEHRCIREALKRRIPIAGVCHGSQIINTYFGGTLKLTPQKLGENDFLIAHRMPVHQPYTDNFHLADLEPGSRIARVLGAERVVINSSHSRRSFEMGKGLKVTARALDGVVEAFEHETLPVMAFQFHPERMVYDGRFVELIKESLSVRTGVRPHGR